MKKIAICEDDNSTRELLCRMASEWAQSRGCGVQVSGYPDAESFLFDYEDQKEWDILILDIQMKELSGMALAKLLRERKESAAVLFVTGVREAVFEGYQVQAVDYLLKPLERERFFPAMDQAAERCKKSERSILVQAGDSTRRIEERDIVLIESQGHNTLLYLRQEVRDFAGNGQRILECRKSIGHFEKELDPKSFVACHRSYLVRLAEIAAIRKQEVQMSDGSVIPIARGKWETVNRAWLSWYRGER